MKKILFSLILFISSNVCFAQVNENFSDGDFTTSPVWAPDNVSNWTVVSNLLRSNSAIASSSFYISTPSARAVNTQWEFWVNLQFNTSSANFVDVFLTSDYANPTTAGNNGYFVRVGGTPDEISLYKMTNGISSILINGMDGVTNSSNTTLRIKVIRDANNLWTLERDLGGSGSNYFLEGSVTDNSFTTSQFFCLRIQQSTASFFNKHFFDDIYVGNKIVETDPPLLQSIQVVSAHSLSLLFNEKLDQATAEDEANFFVDNGVGNPFGAVLQADGQTILLTFATAFVNGVSNTLSVQGVKDLVGNVITPSQKPFLFFQPVPAEYKSVIINEIMADPAPIVQLPESEYIEVYNRTNDPFDIGGWTLRDATSTTTLPSTIILPKEYLILTATSNSSKFSGYGKVLGVTSFPSLNNSGEAIVLKSKEGLLIDSVNYNINWYHDPGKQDGGWSLELIDPGNTCAEETNWTSSEDEKGGTPGKMNSVNANKPDLTGPRLLSANALDSKTLQLEFDEKLSTDLKNVSFTLSPATVVSQVSFFDKALRTLQLQFESDLQIRQLYSVTVTHLFDCAGNLIQENFNTLNFSLPETPDSLDVVINEILFNPRPSGVDFLEIYNRSLKFINLKNWSVANFENGLVTNPQVITSDNLILPPQSYLVLSASPEIIVNQYPKSQTQNMRVSNLPGFPDEEGSVCFVSSAGMVIDYFLYNDNFHTPMLKDTEGVSLERISFDIGSNDKNNWKSASSHEGFATPGYLNSNARLESSFNSGSILIDPEIFSPGAVGRDFTRINYRFDQGGLVANIRVLDSQGRLVKELANNETLGSEGSFRWDGDRDDGSKARLGYYIVWAEIFDLNGTVNYFRKRVVISGL